MPSVIPLVTRTIINLTKIATPIILVIMGMIDMAKSVAGSDAKKITEYRGEFLKRLLAGAIVFLVITIVQFLVGLVASAIAQLKSFLVIKIIYLIR